MTSVNNYSDAKDINEAYLLLLMSYIIVALCTARGRVDGKKGRWRKRRVQGHLQPTCVMVGRWSGADVLIKLTSGFTAIQGRYRWKYEFTVSRINP